MFSMLLCSKWHYYEAISHSIRVLKDCSVYHCDCRVCLETQFSQWIATNLFRSDIVILLPFPSTALPKDRVAQAVLAIVDQFRTGELCRGHGCYILNGLTTQHFVKPCAILYISQPPSPHPPTLGCFTVDSHLTASQQIISAWTISSSHLGHHFYLMYRPLRPPRLSLQAVNSIYNALKSSLLSATQTTPEMWKC